MVSNPNHIYGISINYDLVEEKCYLKELYKHSAGQCDLIEYPVPILMNEA